MALALPLLAGDMTKVRVKVMNLDGKPVDRASVVVKFVKGRSAVKLGKKVMTHWEMRTNQDGIAKIPELPQGQLLVQVIAKGYQTFGGTFSPKTPAPGRNAPACVKRSLPWIGKTQHPKVVG